MTDEQVVDREDSFENQNVYDGAENIS